MKMIIVTLSIIFTLSTHDALAQGGGMGGNGGDGIMVDGKYCILDLAEAGICKTVDQSFESQLSEFNAALAKETIYHSSLQKLLYVNLAEFDALPFSVEVKNALRFLLYRMGSADQATFRMVLLGFHWSFTDLSLVNIGDEDTFIDTKLYPLQQVAIRSKNTIQISSPIFNQLSLTNQIALISHEVLYSLVKPTLRDKKWIQLSRTARDLNGKWFETFTKGKTPEWGFTRWLPGIAWEIDAVTHRSLFNYLTIGNYGAVGIPVQGGMPDVGEATRYYVPLEVVTYGTGGYEHNSDTEIQKNKVDSFSVYWEVQDYGKTTPILFGMPGQIESFMQHPFGEKACKSLIAKKNQLGAVGFSQRYSDLKFSRLSDSDTYVVSFTEGKIHSTSAWGGWGENNINSVEFKVGTLEECKKNMTEAYMKLRRTGRHYYEGRGFYED